MQSTTASTRTFMSTPPEKEKPKKPSKLKSPAVPAVSKSRLPWILVAALILFSLFMFGQYRQAQHKLQATKAPAAGQQTAEIVRRVSKLILLPTGETPTVVTVKDAAKLKGEQFYADAQNGDVTLVYGQHKRAILYRPSANIIVNVANVTVTPTGS
jgi:hypothetical protein